MIIATVTAISGQAWARDAAGNLRELRIGDTLQEGEVLVTAEGGRVELDVGGGADPTVIQGGQEVAMSPELDAEAPVTEEEASALDEDLETLLTAIDEGEGDLLVDLDAPAAGTGPGGSAEGGHSFVRLARIVEPLTPLSYAYGLGQLEEVEFPEDEFLAQAAEEDSTPGVATEDLDGDGDTVWESALTEGSGGGVATTGGAFQIDTGGDELALIEVQDADGNWVAISETGTAVQGDYGVLSVNPDGSWTYTLSEPLAHPLAGETGASDQLPAETFAVRVTDDDGDVSAPATLTITITDDGPTAVEDAGLVAEDTTTALTGDVLLNDTLGADRPESVAFDDTQASYGTFTDNGDGTWSYLLDTTSAAVQGLSEGETLTETFAYTLTDADGDISTATLTVTITGQDDGVLLTGISAGSAEQTVLEANLPAGSDADATALTQSGTFSFVALDELGSLTIAGQSLTLAELQALSADSPLAITTDHGTLLITGFSGDAAGGTLSYSYTLDATVDNDTVSGATGTEYLDSFAVGLVDADGSSATASLDIRIVDDAPSLDAGNLAIANIAGSYEGSYELIPGADTQDFADQASLQWLNAAEGYSLVYDAESSTADLQVFNGVYNEGEDTFFTLAVSADGTYTFELVQPAPVLEVPVESLLAGVTGGSNLPQYVFDASLFGGYFEVVVTGSNDDGDGTLTISATELGVNDNVVHGDKGDTLTFDVVPVSGFDNVTLSELTFEIAETAGAKPGDMVELRIVYDGDGGETVYSEAIGDDYSITVSTDPSLTVDFIELAPADKVSLKIEGLSAGYAILEYPDDYQLDFALTGTDADGDEAVSDFSVVVNTTDTGSYEITGTVESDTLYGTGGDDTLTGGPGADTFDWNLGDEGSADSPSLDTVTDFSVGEGDMLDISDMLSGMPDGADLSSFIQAAPSDSGTMLYISTEGSLADGDLSGADQMILLSNVEMGDLSSLQFLQSLIEEGQLEID
ncbi:type I secretion C-terminal target domain (VC_A0849 subclass) [Halomonas shengliensis]|uniref:Type I secretion C-terminal target domain (VC_A0849 subclass) n=1 Tax=Halomonas shengliensis TaxID=419597 RepID=A0A1H0NJK4_9GAMM|nr:retention module-containing protein [Halomonas shengliensis]SDO92942.1 type I secretion C-terminal target domain (VC_A0849 subclass) [Halomonas shengliensis]